MRTLLFSCIMLLSQLCTATNVRWGDVELMGEGANFYRIFCEFHGAYAVYPIIQTQNNGGGGYSVSVACEFYDSSQNWFLAKEGDLVEDATMRFQSDSKYLLRHEMGDGPDINSGSFDIEPGSSVYLAFVCSDFKEYPSGISTPSFVYGWLQLGMDQTGVLYLGPNAYDLDGGPMIVGGGAWEGGIPEPSGGVLFLLGVAALGLRRASFRR